MSLKPMKLKKFKPRYKLANFTRFAAVVLFFLFAVTAVYIVVANNNDLKKNPAANVPTPVITPEPEPTPPPIEVPEGKALCPVSVTIDAGHGGRDPGTVSPYEDDLHEKDITLDIAKKVEELLTGKGIKVNMTRETDDHLSDVIKEDLLARADVANKSDASLFVSIHVNAYDLKYKGAASVSGLEVYYLNKDTTYTDFTEERLAEIIGQEVSSAADIKFNGVKSNALSVLRNTEMPAVLVETAYITNKEDHARLASKKFRDATARGIADGIEKALKEVQMFQHDGELYVFKEVREGL
ncbi:MAG TPA: N-acetylmuramoyl-L-alanine amidase [Ruminiclostridium sp.]|nr:N-acetylmuramoyl-L-alanine amidase [Ruminiclostridium sp.]